MVFSSKKLSVAAALFTLALADPWPKRGLDANDNIPISQFGGTYNGRSSQVNWQYNWDSTTSQKQSWAEYVPMLWGTASDHTNQWSNNAWSWINNGGTGHLLAFNEPDLNTQSNLSPGDAVNAWRQYMEPFYGHAQLGAPAVTNGGYNWLSQFLQACSGCHIDFIPVHWYNPWTLEKDFENWVNSICSLAGGRPVWITEFQGNGTLEQQAAFLQSALPFLDNNPCVYRYAYFGTANNGKDLLQNGGPALSCLGTQYAFSPYGSGNL
ncbi:glycosyl hydrolase catalytic core domain-containing protein [Trichoderma velutinum]